MYALYVYIIYALLNVSVLGLYLRINNSGLFAWISLTAVLELFYLCMGIMTCILIWFK